MLCYGRLASHLSRITRQAANYPDLFKHVGFINTSTSKYSSKSKKGKTGSTVKVEECLPKSKTQKKVPPPPPPPPPPPIHSTAPPVLTPHEQKPPQLAVPLCEERNSACPSNCPPIAQEECHIPKDGSDGSQGKDSNSKLYTKLIAALLICGGSMYAYYYLFLKDGKKKDNTWEVVDRKKRRQVVPNPQVSDAIPTEIPYLLIGGGTAAFSAFRSIKARDPMAKVLVITNEGDMPYMRPPLSKELWYQNDDELASQLIFRQWNGKKRSLFYEPSEFYLKSEQLSESKKGGVAVITGWTVEKIDPYNKTVYLQDGHPIKYEKCLIATGATPKVLPAFAEADEKILEKVITFRTKEDYEELMYNIKKPNVKDIVIVGGGFLGSELSTSIARNLIPKGKKIYQVYKEKGVLAQVLPEYLSDWTTKHVISQGVECIPNVEVHDCALKNDKLLLTLSNGQILEADQVVVAIGVEPNTALANKSDLEVDPKHGGFLVNAELEARSNLWVAGDAACFYDVKLGRRRVEHHDHAVISGKLAGENMTDAKKPYLHQSMFWSDLGSEVGFEAIGIIDSDTETFGVFAEPEKDAPEAADNTLEDEDKVQEKEVKNESNTKSEPEEPVKLNLSTVDSKIPTDLKSDDYKKGVIFYLRNNEVIGILLWNIFDRMPVARQLLKRGVTKDEIYEAGKLFQIHED